jgi:hypothetical protein
LHGSLIVVMQLKPIQILPSTIEADALWDKRRTARFFGVSLGTVDQWTSPRSSKLGPKHIKVGALVRFRPADLYEFLDSCPSGGGRNVVV